MLLTARTASVAGGAAPPKGHCKAARLAPFVPSRFVASKRGVAVMASGANQQPERRVLVPIGHGSEEMEAVIVVDVLRRSGALVTVASVEDTPEVVCSRGIKIVADKLVDDCKEKTYDLIVCVGGMPGAERLRDSAALEELVRSQKDAGRKYAAICSTPFVFFQSKGLLDGKRATAHPAFSDGLKDQSKVWDRVVVDGNLTTSRGPGTAFEFALSLVKQLYSEEKAKQVAGPMVMYPFHV